MASSAVSRRNFGSVLMRSAGSAIASFARSFFRTPDIGVGAAFIEEAELVERWFQRNVVTNDGLTVVAAFYQCQRCRNGRATEIRCSRPVLERSVNGRRVGTLTWTVPECSRCDRDMPLDLTNPILVRHARTADGYRPIPMSVKLLFQMSFVSEKS